MENQKGEGYKIWPYSRLKNPQQEPRLETRGGKIRKQSTEDPFGDGREAVLDPAIGSIHPDLQLVTGHQLFPALFIENLTFL